MKILFTIVTKQATLIRRTTVLSFPLQLVFPAKSDANTAAEALRSRANVLKHFRAVIY
jgi:hypothetical protein